MQALKEVVGVLRDKADECIPTMIERALRVIGAVSKGIGSEDGKQDYEVEFANRAFLLLTELLKHWSNGKILA